MTEAGLISGEVTQEWRLVPVQDIIVQERLRDYDEAHIANLRRSFTDLGGQLQLQPLLLDERLILIDGAHRLEAMRREGWEFASCLIWDGLTEENRRLLEGEANIVRKAFTPIELENIWRTVYEPAFRAKSSISRTSGLKRGAETPVPGNTWDGEKPEQTEPKSLVQAARETVGKDLDWLNKIADVRSLAESETAPEELRRAAERGLQKLAKQGAAVDPIHKELLKIQDVVQRKGEDPTERRARELEKVLDKTLTDTTLLAERLAGQLHEDLESAARLAPSGGESVRAVRIALTHALAETVAVECKLTHDPAVGLEQFGQEIMKLLSALTLDRLELKAKTS